MESSKKWFFMQIPFQDEYNKTNGSLYLKVPITNLRTVLLLCKKRRKADSSAPCHPNKPLLGEHLLVKRRARLKPTPRSVAASVITSVDLGQICPALLLGRVNEGLFLLVVPCLPKLEYFLKKTSLSKCL